MNPAVPATSPPAAVPSRRRLSADLQTTDTLLRADAARNRRRILAAAAELFAANGLSVGLHEIAHHAGVGVGTAYRRFPDKRQLIEALFEERLDHLAKLAERALAADDPVGRAHPLPRAGGPRCRYEPQTKGDHHRQRSRHRAHGACARHTRPPTEQLVRRAQASGNLRADVVSTDLPLLQFRLSSAAELTPPDAPQLWRRSLALALDGLRTPDPHPLPKPGLNAQQARRRHAQERQQPT